MKVSRILIGLMLGIVALEADAAPLVTSSLSSPQSVWSPLRMEPVTRLLRAGSSAMAARMDRVRAAVADSALGAETRAGRRRAQSADLDDCSDSPSSTASSNTSVSPMTPSTTTTPPFSTASSYTSASPTTPCTASILPSSTASSNTSTSPTTLPAISSASSSTATTPPATSSPTDTLPATSSTSVTPPAASSSTNPVATQAAACFPALNFTTPNKVPTWNGNATKADGVRDGWWCNWDDEYAFMGFSYDLSACPSKAKMSSDFKRMRSQFNARYVRLYSACDKSGFMDDVIDTAYSANIGVHALLWFGFDGTLNAYRPRKASMLKTLKSNPKAPLVVRALAAGSEPLFDWAISPSQLASEVADIKSQLKSLGIKVTVSDMPYGFQIHHNAPQVFNAIDLVEGNILPFFDSSATTGGSSKTWSFVHWSLNYFLSQPAVKLAGKKVLFTQTGWPSNQNVWKANSRTAVASVGNEHAYFSLLDSKCEMFKHQQGGGVGWFAQIWEDSMLDGWGIVGQGGKPKFRFAPRTEC